MGLPKISVVVPSFNQARFLAQTLDSIVEQRYPELELIVVDGGSTDGSVEILERYAKHCAFWVSEPDGGQTPALIKGFARATGDVLCWVNSDDLLEPWTLLEVGRFFEAHPAADAVFGDALWIDEDGRVLREQREIPFNRFIWMHTYNYIPGMSMFWTRRVYEAVGGLDARFNLAMDADLWIRIADVTPIHHVRHLWSRSRLYSDQKTLRLRRDSLREDLEIRARYWGSDRPALRRTKRASAMALRVLWKASTGCYPRGYVRDLTTLVGRP
jgi:glycosyltransferase involved in cell wall biosynthesis